MASFVWTCDDLGFSGTELRYLAAAVAVVAGLLMVSRVRYNSFKGSGQGARAERVPFTAIVVAVAHPHRAVDRSAARAARGDGAVCVVGARDVVRVAARS